MRRFHFLSVFIALVALLTAVCACDQRDPQAEFEALRIAVFPTPKAGLDVAQEYIDHFHSRKGNRVNEVTDIRNLYRSMEDFFSQSFRSYPEFMKGAASLDKEFSLSVYEGVKNTWKNLYGQERDRLLTPLMDGITEDTFDAFFKTQVRYLCEGEYKTWDIESIDQVRLDTPAIIRDGTIKEASGVYRAHMRGNILKIRTSTATVSVSGRIGVDPSGNMTAELTGHDFQDGPILGL